jgi:hypothetical protein
MNSRPQIVTVLPIKGESMQVETDCLAMMAKGSGDSTVDDLMLRGVRIGIIGAG